MIEDFKQALSEYTFLGPKDIFNLFSIVKLKTLKKGQHVIQSGDMNYNVIIVIKGLLRSYVTMENGDELTVLFIPERKNGASSQTIFKDLPSLENIVAIEDTYVATADFRQFEKMASRSPAVLKLQNKILKDVLTFTIDQAWFHMLLSPEQRYEKFLKENPTLEQRVLQKDLASYLGITPPSLSRLKARII